MHTNVWVVCVWKGQSFVHVSFETDDTKTQMNWHSVCGWVVINLVMHTKFTLWQVIQIINDWVFDFVVIDSE